MSDKYKNGKIYTIRYKNDDSLIYVGSTIQPLFKRWFEHNTYLCMYVCIYVCIYIYILHTQHTNDTQTHIHTPVSAAIGHRSCPRLL